MRHVDSMTVWQHTGIGYETGGHRDRVKVYRYRL